MAMADCSFTKTPTKGNKRLPSSSTGSTPNSKHRPTPNLKYCTKGKAWTQEEDDALLTFIQSFGTERRGTWVRCSDYLKAHGITRTAAACTNRYKQNFKGIDVDLASVMKTRTIEVQTDVSFLSSEEVAWASRLSRASTEYNSDVTSDSFSASDVSGDESNVLHLSHSPVTLRKLLEGPLDDGICLLSDDSGFDSLDSDSPVHHETPRRGRQHAARSLFSSTPVARTSVTSHNLSSEPHLYKDSSSFIEPQHHQDNSSISEPQLQQHDSSLSEPHQHQYSSSSSENQEPVLSIEEPMTDHGYGKKQKPPRRVRAPVMKSEESVLASKLKCKIQPLTLKEEAQVLLAATNVQSVESVAAKLLDIPTLKNAIVKRLSDDIGERPSDMKNTKNGFVSVLMSKDFDDLQNSELVNIATEFQQQFPELFTLILAVMSSKDVTDPGCLHKLIPRLSMVYAIMMQARVTGLSRLQQVITVSLAEQICNQKVYDRLNVLGVTLSHTSLINVSKKVGKHYKDLLVEAVKDGKRLRLIGDNLNFMQGVAYENIDKHDHMVHMFASAGIVTEKVYTEKPDTPQIHLRDLTIEQVSVTPDVYAELKKDMVVLVGEVIGKYLPSLHFICKSLPKELFPPHPEFQKKTEVIPLPVLNYNEQYGGDAAKILDYYEDLVGDLPLPAGETVQIGGDQLTRQRFSTAQNIRLGNVDPPGRYAHLGPTTFEFFHLAMNYLEKIVFKPLWNTTGEEEVGTLRGEKQRIIRNSVKPDVHKAYDADKQFFLNYTHAHIVEAAMDFFGMETRNDVPTANIPPEEVTEDEKKAWVYETLGALIDKYAFPFWSGEDRDIYTPQEVSEEVQHIVMKSAAGNPIYLRKSTPTVTLAKEKPDGKKVYAHYVMEAGLTYIYLLRLCKTPDRSRLLNLFKLMMIQLKGKSNGAKYPLELLQMLFQQYSELTEKEAHQVLHGCFVNTKGHSDTNIPADLQMEWIVKENKTHIKHMYSNKTVDNIFNKSSSLPGMQSIAENYDGDADIVVRSKTHTPKNIDRDEVQIMDDLRSVRPFARQPGRSYKFNYRNLEISQAKKVDPVVFNRWFNTHKQTHLRQLPRQ